MAPLALSGAGFSRLLSRFASDASVETMFVYSGAEEFLSFSKPNQRSQAMARFDQYRGLNEWAQKTVRKREKVRIEGTMEFADGRRKRFVRWARVPVARIRVIGKIEGAWNPQVANLHRYTMRDGKVYEEYIQAEPWSSGPVYHIALKDARTGKPVPESLWTDEEIDHA